MRNFTQAVMPAFILTIITTFSALALSFTFNKVQPIIIAQEAKKLRDALTYVMPSGEKFEKITDEYYKVYAGGQLIGYTVTAYGSGYSSNIKTLVGVDTAWQLKGIKVLYQLETPGLGTKINSVKPGETRPWFQAQFTGLSIPKLNLKRDGGPIDQITGATISSRAVVKSVREAVQALEGK